MGICNKAKHKDYIDAIKNIKSVKNKKDIQLGAYYCAACNAYHITSNVRSGSKFVKFKG